METPGENFEAPPNSTGGSEEENVPESHNNNLLKNLFLLLVLIVLIVACFWVSFLLGKRILTPPKRVAPVELSMATFEALPTSDHLKKLAIEATKEVENIPITLEAIAKVKKAIVKKTQASKTTYKFPVTPIVSQQVKKEVQPQKIVQKPKSLTAKKVIQPVAAKTTTRKTVGYYKVQVGLFGSRAAADTTGKKIQTAGFDSYVKKLTNGWRVQAGAFKTKAEADRLKASLKAHGFQSLVIYE